MEKEAEVEQVRNSVDSYSFFVLRKSRSHRLKPIEAGGSAIICSFGIDLTKSVELTSRATTREKRRMKPMILMAHGKPTWAERRSTAMGKMMPPSELPLAI